MKNEVCERCEPLVEELRKEVEGLKRRLAAYENAHTPPSRLRKERIPPSDAPAKRGAPEGHPGTTRPTPEPTMTVEVVKEKCDHCSARLGKPFHVERRIIEEIPEPQPIEVTEYRIGHFLCKQCGSVSVADAPVPEGRFGSRLCAHVALLKFSDRLPHRLVARALERQFGITLTASTVLDITRRVSESVRSRYDAILGRIRNSPYIHIDETELRVGGRTYQVWVFTTPTDTLYVIRPTRGQTVPEEIIGNDYAGIVVSDGYKLYENFGKAQQRCWAHLLREAKQLAKEHDSAHGLYAGLCNIYARLVRVLVKDKWRAAFQYEKFTKELQQWIDLTQGYRELRKFGVTLKNGMNAWFTCLLHPGVPPTNNHAERQLREIVVQRKIFGTLRNEKGTVIMERIMSVLMTANQRGTNPFKTLQRAVSS